MAQLQRSLYKNIYFIKDLSYYSIYHSLANIFANELVHMERYQKVLEGIKRS